MSNADETRPVVDAEVELASGRRVSARMIELNQRSITVAARARGLPALDGGDRVSVTLSSPALTGPVVARAHVDRVIIDGGVGRIALHFAEESQFQMLLDSGIGSVFNRRFAYRIQPADGEPISIVVHPAADAPVEIKVEPDVGRPELLGTAEDISVTGVGFNVTGAGAGELAIGARIVMVFDLPPNADRVRVSGRVRYVTDTPSGTRIGADYEQGTALYEPASEAITSYVMGRQRALLRTKRTAST